MTEAGARAFHRRLGIILVWFMMGQALSGALLSLGAWLGPIPYVQYVQKVMGLLHYNWDPLGSGYRVLLGLGTWAQGISGIIIFTLIRARRRKGR